MAVTASLPATEILLVSGGDARILPDPGSGVSAYGCRPHPDPELVALGSSTASTVSVAGFAAADSLRSVCLERLRCAPAHRVYADEAERLRGELLQMLGFASSDGLDLVLAASGTDLHLLAAQWLRPHRTVMIAPSETGSGVTAAVQGLHYNRRAALAGAVPVGAPLGDYRTELATLAPRHPDGSLRDPADIDSECAARVDEAAAAGGSVLLVLTDVSKTGLIVPGSDAAHALQARWPERVEVLVDACQFRLAPESVRAYAKQGWLVALTGSKFMAGPTFSAALLVPSCVHERRRKAVLHPAAGAYSCPADWPAGWAAARALPAASNFGLLLRWEAALSELRAFGALPDAKVTDFLRTFAQAVRNRLAAEACFRELPVHPILRPQIGGEAQWDRQQTLFPFLLREPGTGRPLHRDETRRVHRALLTPPGSPRSRRFQFGQPVDCGEQDGTPVSALRLCVSAPMAVAACRDGKPGQVIGDALASLDEAARLLRRN